MALVKSRENSENTANPVGYNGWGLEGWAGVKKIARRKRRIPGGRNTRQNYIDPGQEAHWGHPGYRYGFENSIYFLWK